MKVSFLITSECSLKRTRILLFLEPKEFETMSYETVEAFTFNESTKRLKILNQLLLPQEIEYVEVPDCERGHHVIKSMMVRGAPCIAAVGCLSIIVELNNQLPSLKLINSNKEQYLEWLDGKSAYLKSSRPTAVNLKNALERLRHHADELVFKLINPFEVDSFVAALTEFCQLAIKAGLELNKRLSYHGYTELVLGKQLKHSKSISVLTHCNTGSLATVGYGTALGVIRTLHDTGVLKMAYCTETRPYNQGSRLTAWELTREKIPATLIADNMVAFLMETRNIDAVLVGADCVASNGDTANKIGTLQIAILAKHYKVPFYVAAPSQSIDLTIKDQRGIHVEKRPASELRRIQNVVLAPDEVNVWNPCFDITPPQLITGIITEFGTCKPEKIESFVQSEKFKKENQFNALF